MENTTTTCTTYPQKSMREVIAFVRGFLKAKGLEDSEIQKIVSEIQSLQFSSSPFTYVPLTYPNNWEIEYKDNDWRVKYNVEKDYEEIFKDVNWEY